MDIDYSMLPEHMQEGAKLYIERGIEGGSFMSAVLSNNLVNAFGAADETNSRAMKQWAMWLYSECPRSAWGSEEAIEAWINKGGLRAGK